MFDTIVEWDDNLSHEEHGRAVDRQILELETAHYNRQLEEARERVKKDFFHWRLVMDHRLKTCSDREDLPPKCALLILRMLGRSSWQSEVLPHPPLVLREDTSRSRRLTRTRHPDCASSSSDSSYVSSDGSVTAEWKCSVNLINSKFNGPAANGQAEPPQALQGARDAR
eukprot:TRINITY_DN71317_c0_g1_i1.p1 TRINITY_DN71317_c0_g1~~TRINITY_DN71317_c0_g1_i1.p1  ORF type:complete len:169 (-),score=18.28 TRINITY_DN71317_c0_g1_i1:172-678(-)